MIPIPNVQGLEPL